MSADDLDSQLNILSLQSNSLGVDTVALGVVQNNTHPHLHGLLQTDHSGSLEPEVRSDSVGVLSDHPLERELTSQDLGALLVSSDFSEGDGSRLESVRLLQSSGSRSSLSRYLGGELFTWGFSSSRFTSGLFSSCHFLVVPLFQKVNVHRAW